MRTVQNEVPASRTELVPGARMGDPATYAYVAKRAHSIIGLAEARNLPDDVARAAVDRLADGLETCVREEACRNTVGSSGAARIAVHIDGGGAVRETAVRLSSETGAARVGALCLVVPMRLMTYPPNGSGSDRGLAVEALWTCASPPGSP
jgi:hypothetical protein